MVAVKKKINEGLTGNPNAVSSDKGTSISIGYLRRDAKI